MDNPASNSSADLLNAINHKLDGLLATVSSLAERQQINDEVMSELVSFFQRFRGEILESQRGAADAVVVKTNELLQSSVRLAEAVTGGLNDIGSRNERASSERFQVLRQLVETGLRKSPAGSGKIRCLFLVHMIESWDAQFDIYHAMRQDSRFEPIVASINRVLPGDSGHNGEESISAALDGMGIEHVRLGTQHFAEARETLRWLAPDVVFRQSQWDRDYPPAFSTTELGFTRHCVVPYGTSIVQKFSHSEKLSTQISPMSFDQPYHRAAWRVFCENEITQSYYKSFRHSDPNKFVLSGYPKYERLLKFKDSLGVWPIPEPDGRAYRVIWAPHHSVGADWLAFGVFHQMYLGMLEWARSAPHIHFVLKPHPGLFPLVINMGLVSRAQLDNFKAVWQALPNCAIVDGQYGELFAASDLMLTDGMSFLTEYQLFDKPLVFIDSQRHVPLNALGQMAVDCADTVTTLAAAKAAVLSYADGKSPDNAEAHARLIRTVLPGDRSSTAIILDAIAEGLGKESRPVTG